VIRFSFDFFHTRRLTDALKLAFVLSVNAAFGPHYLPLVPLLWLPIVVLVLLSSKNRIRTLVSLIGAFALVLILFLALNPGYVSLTQLIFSKGSAESAQAILRSRSLEYFYRIYDSITIGRLLTLSSWLPYSQLVWAGLVWPLFGFSFLVLQRRREGLALLASESLLIGFVFLVQSRSWVFLWIYDHFPPTQILSDAFMVYYLSWAIVAILVAFSFNQLEKYCEVILRRVRSIRLNRVLKVAPLLLLLILFFLYVPAYESRMHFASSYSDATGPVANPPVYDLVFSWLRNQSDFNQFKYYLVPHSGSTIANLVWQAPNFFGPPLFATYDTARYVSFVQSVFVQNATRRLGALLAPASVEYVIVVFGTREPDMVRWTVTGPPAVEAGGLLTGSPDLVLRLLLFQLDLRLVRSGSDYFIFENLLFAPKITFYPNLGYVVGDRITIASLSEIPGVRFQDFALTFQSQSRSSNELEMANYVVLNDRDWLDGVLGFSLAEQVIPLSSYVRLHAGDSLGWSLASYDDNALTRGGELWPNQVLEGSGYFNLGGGFIDAKELAELTVSFSSTRADSYAVLLRALYSPYSTGQIRVSVGDSEIGTLRPFAPSFLGFKWMRLGSVHLDNGSHEFTLSSNFGYAAVDGLAIIPETQLTAGLKDLWSEVASKNFLATFSADYPGLTKKNLNASNLIQEYAKPENWGGLDPSFSIAPGNESLDGLPTIRASGVALSSLHNQTAVALGVNLRLKGDFLQIWVKSTTQKFGIAIRGLPSSNYELLGQFQTHLVPNTWTPVLVPIDNLRNVTVGLIVFYQGGENAGFPQEMIVGPVLDVSIRSWEYVLRLGFGRFPSGVVLVETAGGCVKPQVSSSQQLVEMKELGHCWFSGTIDGSDELSVAVEGGTRLLAIVVMRNVDSVGDRPLILSTVENSESDFLVKGASVKSSFLVVGTAFHSGWVARIGTADSQHFQAFSFLNGFYIPPQGKEFTIHVTFTEVVPLIANWASILFLIVMMVVVKRPNRANKQAEAIRLWIQQLAHDRRPSTIERHGDCGDGAPC
jgi:hypothetical protein